MAQFPALSPSAAPITFGAVPVTTASSLNGSESRIRHGTAEIGRRLRLTFENVSESDFLAILSHYREQRGGFDSFGFSTTTLAAALTPSGYAWLYASPPQVVDEHTNVFTVACEFKAEPRGLVVAPGDTWRSFFSTFTPGAGNGGIAYGASAAWVTSSTTFRPQSDAYFSSVSLLLHFDGSNGSTTFIDSSSNTKTISAAGGVQIDASTFKYGTGSASFPSANSRANYLSIPSSADFGFGTGTFTIETWIYIRDYGGDYTAIVDIRNSGSGTNAVLFFYDSTGRVGYYTDSTLKTTTTIPLNTWTHVALVRDSSLQSTIYIAGVASASFSDSGTKDSNHCFIGRVYDAAHPGVYGYIDDLRITKGAARYTANFTPPSAAFPNV